MKTRKISVFIISFVLFSTLTILIVPASPALEITLATNKESYYIKENVDVFGTLKLDGSPVEDALVGVQINDPINPILYRTVPTDTIPTANWKVEVIDVYLSDGMGNPKSSQKRGTSAYFTAKVQNNDIIEHSVLTTVTVLDGRNIPLGAASIQDSIPKDGAIRSYIRAIEIPSWVPVSNATVYANAYTELPTEGGNPYCPEKSSTFRIIAFAGTELSSGYSLGTLQSSGNYSLTFRLSHEPTYGVYTVAASSKYHPWGEASTSTTFEVESASYSPIAAFDYYPPEPYVNQTVTFDASTSTADGGEIISYVWDFGDGTPSVNETDPITYHKYAQVDTFIVTLNVTDSEGKWSTLSRQITTLPPIGPTADFIWYPAKPDVNQTVTFDASTSSRGWNGTHYTPIVNYEWDFGDETPVTPTPNKKINHTYTAEGNYTVTLTVTDTQDLSDSTSANITVSAAPALEGDVNGDGFVDGRDLGIVARAFGSTPEDPQWDPRADVNGDSFVDGRDLGIVARHFGESAS